MILFFFFTSTEAFFFLSFFWLDCVDLSCSEDSVSGDELPPLDPARPKECSLLLRKRGDAVSWETGFDCCHFVFVNCIVHRDQSQLFNRGL